MYESMKKKDESRREDNVFADQYYFSAIEKTRVVKAQSNKISSSGDEL